MSSYLYVLPFIDVKNLNVRFPTFLLRSCRTLYGTIHTAAPAITKWLAFLHFFYFCNFISTAPVCCLPGIP